MAYGAFADTTSQYRDLEELVDYREYDGAWTTWFEENWLKPRLKALGYSHVRLCVQRRLACSVGDKPTEAKVRSLVAWIAGRRENKFLKTIHRITHGLK